MKDDGAKTMDRRRMEPRITKRIKGYKVYPTVDDKHQSVG
jgi:hypothetical protein